MCGIIGAVYKNRLPDEVIQQAIPKVLQQIKYRGPDGSGCWYDDRIALGHRRLSIIDLSSAGAQPFESKKYGLVITYNGEIYNYQAIKEILIQNGYKFQSQTDTEVVLFAYDFFGEDFLKQLRGMFAFCLYDQKRNCVFLARDPIGEKPLFYYIDQQKLIFSSEVKSFHAFTELPLHIDDQSMKSYLVLQYIPGDHTIYDEVKEVDPGCFLKINLNSWELKKKTYWSIFDKDRREVPTSTDEIDWLLESTTRARLIGDVKIGLLLSGGIDSSLLAWYIHNQGSRLMAFTAGFDRDELDEYPYAKEVADSLGIELIQINGGIVTPDIFEAVIFHADEPLGDPACIPTFLLSREIAKYVTVVLSGEGADELFLGYDYYRQEMQFRKFNPLIISLLHQPIFGSCLHYWSNRSPLNRIASRLEKVLFSTYDLGASRWSSVFLDKSVNSIFSQTDNIENSLFHLMEIEGELKEFTKFDQTHPAPLLLDLKYWLPDDLLMKVDRMTMAHSIEARTPFLDLDLIEAAINLPYNEKINHKTGKIILRKFFESKFNKKVNPEFAWRKKHGFATPVKEWLLGPLRDLAEERFSETWINRQGIFASHEIVGSWKSFCQSEGKVNARKVWILLCFQSWYAQHEQKYGL
jgi:asparagine synthase (glutamine-hydrolysing)